MIQHLAQSKTDVFFTSMASAGACTELLTHGTHLTRPCMSTNVPSPFTSRKNFWDEPFYSSFLYKKETSRSQTKL
uniref:Putative ovule protein n=1 Tax=Solanum chacoense TaxID=4108 RepID=A0A0V0GMW1_SOLCH